MTSKQESVKASYGRRNAEEKIKKSDYACILRESHCIHLMLRKHGGEYMVCFIIPSFVPKCRSDYSAVDDVEIYV